MNKPLPPRSAKQEAALTRAEEKIAEQQAKAGRTTKPVQSTGGNIRRGQVENA